MSGAAREEGEVAPRGESCGPNDGVGATDTLVHALEVERDALLQVIEHAPEASLVLLDPDFRFVYVNETYARGCRIPKQDLLGRGHFELFPDEENEAIFRRALETGEPAEFKAKPFVFEGEPERGVTYWDWTLTPLAGEDGHVRSLVFSLVDVTPRVVRERLDAAAAELDRVLHSTLDAEEIVSAVLTGASAALECDSIGVALKEGDWWVGRFSAGGLEPLDHQRFTPEQARLSELATTSRSTIVVNDAESDPEWREHLAPYGIKSVMTVPLLVRDRVVGSLSFNRHAAAVPFTGVAVDFGNRVGSSLALAIANARIVDEAVRKRALEDALNRMLTVFITARDPDDVLREVVEESVRACAADYGVISVVAAGEWVVRHAFGQGGEARLPIRYAYDERPVIVTAAETKELQLVENAMADAHTNKAIMEAFSIGAFAAVPLVMRGELLGVLELAYERRTTLFDPVLTDFLQRLMIAASVALDKAREVERQRRVADTLQEAMLILPERVEGLEFGHAYYAASDTARVGGDFYDMFELDYGLVGITVGDISGKGLNAAALTSLVKNTIRARAVEKGTTAADAVALADRVLYKSSTPELFATVFFGLLDRRDGRLSYCSAGHTSGAVVQPDGTVHSLPANSPIACAIDGVSFRTSESRLEPGDVLFLYTDGLVEARRPGTTDFFGEERLFATLAGRAGGAPGTIVDGVIAEVLEFAGGALRDDVAVLEIRRTGGDSAAGLQTKLDLG